MPPRPARRCYPSVGARARASGLGSAGRPAAVMSLLEDGGTADPAVWADWEVAVRKVRAGEVDAAMRLK